jgi:hypothetical protein
MERMSVNGEFWTGIKRPLDGFNRLEEISAIFSNL